MQTRRACLPAWVALAAAILTTPAYPEDWPQKPVKIFVPFAAGGNSDFIARVIGQRLGETLGQQFVFENRTGASGAIAAEAVARAPADGYTLFMGSPSQIAIAPAMTKVAYDPVKDFAPISVIGDNPLVLIVNPGVPAHTVKELIDYVRAQPKNTISYGTAGLGSIAHLTAVLFLQRAGLEMIPVMYRGGAPALTDVMAGHLPMYFANLSEVLPQAASGTIRLLAVTGDTRTPQLPDVPTLSESGLAGFRSVTWNGLLAPTGTPRDVIERLHGEIARATRDPAFVERLSAVGVNPLGNTPEQFAALIKADIALWSDAVRVAGIQEK